MFPPRSASGTAPTTASDTVFTPAVETGPAPAPVAPEDQGLFATMEPLDGTEAASGVDTAGEAVSAPSAGDPGAGMSDREAPKPTPPRRRLRLGFGSKVHVGVDISKTHLVCVKTRGQDADCEILGTVVQPLPEGAEPGSPDFVDILRRTLAGLCGSGPVPSIWAASQTARVNVQFVTIPKVGSRQVDNAVYWTAKKEMGFDEGTSIFDFERRGEVEEKGAPRLGALAYTAERDGVRQIRDSFAQAGFPLEGLTMEPFSHQNLFRRHCVPPNGGASAVLHVGQNWSRLEIGSKSNLLFVRVIKTSMAGMEQAVQDALESRGSAGPSRAPKPAPREPEPMEPALLTPEPAAPAAPVAGGESVVDLEQLDFADMNLKLELDVPLEPAAAPAPAAAPGHGTARTVDATQAREVLRCLVYGCDDLDETHPGRGLSDSDIIDMLDPAASRLVRQVEMTLKHFRESLGFESVTRLAVSGLLGASKAFVTYMSTQLGLPCIALDPVGDALARGRDVPGIAAPSVAYTQALGLALSDNAITPNILRTYREKAASRTARALEQWSLVGLAVVLAGLAFVSLDARWTTQGLQAEHQAVARQLQALGGKVNLDTLTHRVENMQRRRAALRTTLARVRTLGVWGEALSLAPEGVGLGTLRVDYGPPAGASQKEAKPKPAGDKPGTGGRLVLEGMITGDGRLFDSKLASYVVALEHSPLFTAATVQKSELEALEGGASGLHFVIALSLVEN